MVRLCNGECYSPSSGLQLKSFFAELKGFIRRNWSYYAEDPDREFSSFLEQCINQVGAREANARGHFRHAGLTIEESDNWNSASSGTISLSESPCIEPEKLLPLCPSSHFPVLL